MWHDNETEIDLINVSHLTGAVSQIIQNNTVSPVTIGVFGDWGSGKSSLLKLVQKEFSEDDRYLCLWFNGWLFEGYEDARAALLGTIIEEIAGRKELSARAMGLINRLTRRINWLSVIKTIGKGGIPLALTATGVDASTIDTSILTSMASMPGLVKSSEESETEENHIDSSARGEIRQFRKDFEKLLSETKIQSLIVFIDDLDRCLPDTIVSTLEAVRLFLSVPNTAFIIAADERLVEFAVRARYPKLEHGTVDIARDYLEKLIQIPIRIPPLSHTEVVAYVNLLFTQLHFEDRIGDILKELRDSESVSIEGFDYQWLKENFDDIPDELINDFALSQQIIGVLAEQLRGNPRQIKRFLNTLMIRLHMSETRGAELNRKALAKLMVLEYTDPVKFEKLANIQASQEGKPLELQNLVRVLKSRENAIAEGKSSKEKKTKSDSEVEEDIVLDSEFESWLTDDSFLRWFKSEPSLLDVDLRPYFYVSRDTMSFSGLARAKMSPKVRVLYDNLISGSDTKVRQGIHALDNMSGQEKSVLVGVMCEFVLATENHKGKLAPVNILMDILSSQPDHATQILRCIQNIPESALSAGAPVKLAGLKISIPQLSVQIDNILKNWLRSTANKQLASAAKKLLGNDN